MPQRSGVGYYCPLFNSITMTNTASANNKTKIRDSVRPVY